MLNFRKEVNALGSACCIYHLLLHGDWLLLWLAVFLNVLLFFFSNKSLNGKIFLLMTDLEVHDYRCLADCNSYLQVVKNLDTSTQDEKDQKSLSESSILLKMM